MVTWGWCHRTPGWSNAHLDRRNADFDGDALNGFLILENEASKAYEVLHPSQRILAPNEPNLSTTIDLPKQILLQMNTFLEYAGVEKDPPLAYV